MPKSLVASVELTNAMTFRASTASGHELVMDASPDVGGTESGARPMELLMAGLGGCTGMDVISILRKKRQEVTGYEVRVQGIRAESHPMIFEDITIEHIITGHHLQHEAVRRAIALSEARYCGAGAMLGRVAQLRHMYCIVEVEMPETSDLPARVPA